MRLKGRSHHEFLAIWLLPFLLAGFASVILASDDDPSVSGETGFGADPEFVDSWIVVKLETALTARTPENTFALTTGLPEVDAAIAETGVQWIDHAFAVSVRTSPRPEAIHRAGLDRIYRFHVPEGSDIRAVVARFWRLPGVAYVEPDFIGRAFRAPDDPMFVAQWNLDQPSDADVDAPEAWDLATGEGVVLGITDSGADLDHPDLVGRLLPGKDLVNDDDDPEDGLGHGTGVSSIASANTDNTQGIAGVCWDCLLLPVKVFADNGQCGATSCADGWVWATDHGARVINFSGGGQGVPQTWYDGVRYAYEAGVFPVAAAGNANAEAILSPAAYWRSIAVGSTNSSDQRASNSSWGRQLDLLAPGVSIWRAALQGGYSNTGSGTSFAAPHVTGALGVMLTVHPSLGLHEARHLLHSGADDQVGSPAEDTEGFDVYHGFGRLNLHRTLQGTLSVKSLRVEGKEATRIQFETPNPLATSYDFVRGDLDALSENFERVDPGSLVCIENDSPDPDTLGHEDTAVPASGEGFFYLARFNAGDWAGSYGGSSRHRDRIEMGEMTAWLLEETEQDAQFGTSVGSAGDVNGDGYDDVIVGAPNYDTTVPTDWGAAFVYAGSSEGVGSKSVWTGTVPEATGWYGWSVASAGDVNHDGYDDIIVGAPHHTNSQSDEGGAYVYYGSAAGPSATANWTAESNQAMSYFGFRVRSAGDVNGDDHDDVLVSAYEYTNGQQDEGRVFLYTGSPIGLRTNPSWTAEADQYGARMGVGIDGAGDVNGDGYDDVIVGAPLYDNGQTDEGRLYVYHGSSLGLGTSPAWTAESDVADARLGFAVAGAGDVNDDGYDDVIGGAWYYSGPESQEGKVYLWLGSASGLGSEPAWSFESNQKGAHLGVAVAGAGDLNGDGYDDVVVGSDSYHLTRLDEGRVWVFLGSEAGLSPEPAWSEVGWVSGAAYGWRTAGAGDVNGDTYDDLIVGARRQDSDCYQQGRAYVYAGSAAGLPPARVPECDGP